MSSLITSQRSCRWTAQTAYFLAKRCFHQSHVKLDLASKYADKLRKRAEEQGISIEELRTSSITKSKAASVPLPESQSLITRISEKREQDKSSPNQPLRERKDNSPVKPLAEFMDLQKIFHTPHTTEQISALWTGFHTSRSGGTGRGFLSAVVPLNTYLGLISKARKFPCFILPLQCIESSELQSDGETTKNAYEFYFLQWALHSPPLPPMHSPLDYPLPPEVNPSSDVSIATVLFTPLLEYKTRQTFATPHLVLTFYTDLASSHGVVLLRGELTPSSTGRGDYLLSQHAAQMLALGLQKFYLADEASRKVSSGKDDNDFSAGEERAEMLRMFNEQPELFKWEELMKHADPTSS